MSPSQAVKPLTVTVWVAGKSSAINSSKMKLSGRAYLRDAYAIELQQSLWR